MNDVLVSVDAAQGILRRYVTGGGPLLLPPLETSSSYVMRRFFALRLSAKCWACSFSMTFAASFGARALIRRNVVILWLWLQPARPLTRR